MADTHFPARDRLNHSVALPPQYCYVPPTPNNFAPKGTIYDGYEVMCHAALLKLQQFLLTTLVFHSGLQSAKHTRPVPIFDHLPGPGRTRIPTFC